MRRKEAQGPPAAAAVRGRPHGIGRRSTRAAEVVSDDLRRGQGDLLEDRRRVVRAALTGIAALGAVTAYQTGVVGHLPDPPVGPFDSDAVDASGEAYAMGAMPDAPIGIASYAVTLVLAAAGGRDRARSKPWLPLALAVKTASDAAWGVYLTAEQASKHRKFCWYCLVAAGAGVAMFAGALPEARSALRTVRAR